MSRIKHLLSSAKCTDYHFINQRTVKLFPFSYILSKDDVIDAINYYIDRIIVYFDVEPRCSYMNFHALKMHDVVPYFYTLLNYYLSLYNNLGATYERYLPELKLTRFCHLPFEKEILPSSKRLLIVTCSLITDAISGKSRYVCYVNNSSYSSESVDDLLSDMRSADPYLFKDFNVILQFVGS